MKNLLFMKERKNFVPTLLLAKGQLWETERGNVEIMEVGKLLAHYRLLHDKRRAPTIMGRVELVQSFLREHGAKLIQNTRLQKVKI